MEHHLRSDRLFYDPEIAVQQILHDQHKRRHADSHAVHPRTESHPDGDGRHQPRRRSRTADMSLFTRNDNPAQNTDAGDNAGRDPGNIPGYPCRPDHIQKPIF